MPPGINPGYQFQQPSSPKNKIPGLIYTRGESNNQIPGHYTPPWLSETQIPGYYIWFWFSIIFEFFCFLEQKQTCLVLEKIMLCFFISELQLLSLAASCCFCTLVFLFLFL
jgi:hypothetical protein